MSAIENPFIDVLFVTYRSPERAKLALDRLLDISEGRFRIWVWHNGDHEETMRIPQRAHELGLLHRFHHSEENVRLIPAMNWVFREGTLPYVTKIDDDAIMPPGWPGPIIDAHENDPRLGVVGSWRFHPSDFEPDLASKKLQIMGGGHIVMRNAWTEGTSLVMKRACIDDIGLIPESSSFPTYCLDLTRQKWINGYHYPFVRYGNLDDPRDPDTLIHSDEDLLERMPLSVKANSLGTADELVAQLRRSAITVQTAPYRGKDWSGWRQLLRRARRRALRFITRDNRRW